MRQSPIEWITRDVMLMNPSEQQLTTELTIQKVDMFPEEEKVRPDGNRRCYHCTTCHVSPCNKKWQRESAKEKTKVIEKRPCIKSNSLKCSSIT